MLFNIATGAMLGFLAGAVYRILLAWNTGQPVPWREVLKAGLCGMLAGAVGAATFGLLSAPTATVGATALRGMSSGAAAAGSAKALNNRLGGLPFDDGLPQAMLFGAAAGVPVGGAAATITTMAARTAVDEAVQNYETGRPLTEGVADASLATLGTGMVQRSVKPGISAAQPEGRGVIGQMAEIKK